MKIKTITICGSMFFIDKMEEIERVFKKRGFTVLVPAGLDLRRRFNWRLPKTFKAKVADKIKYDFIREHFRKIEKSQAVLILNWSKGRQKNYIGGNTFLEMGYAFALHKKIYLLNPIPEVSYKVEIEAMQPIILNGDLGRLRV